MKILGVIPSRYESSRFPGKPLADIAGQSMIQRVYEQCVATKLLFETVVATDDERIKQHVESFGGKVVMTSPDCPNGTARSWETLCGMGDSFDFVINIQGDEPFIRPEQIDELGELLSPEVELATHIKKIEDLETLFDSNIPKVAVGSNGYALYFSRNTIPFLRDIEKDQWLVKQDYYKHIGIYAYRVDVLEKIVSLPEGIMERAEKLEQLRWLENGFRIKIGVTEYDSHGIDVPEDIDRVLSLYN